jgi:hypothetical protein
METTILEEYNIDNIESNEYQVNNIIDNPTDKNVIFKKIAKKIKNKINNFVSAVNLMADVDLLDTSVEPIIIETNIVHVIYDGIKTDEIKDKHKPFQKIEKVIIDEPKIEISKEIIQQTTIVDNYNIDYSIIQPEEINMNKEILEDNKITFQLKIR